MLVGTELEMPVVAVDDFSPAPPEVFLRLWALLSGAGWRAKDFGVVRDVPPPERCIASQQVVTTDTGPLLEIATAPAPTFGLLAAQLRSLEEEAFGPLLSLGFVPLGCGVHPTVRPTPEDYARFRTRRPSYDYAIRERGWRHWTIVDKAAVQEIVDVRFADAPRATRLLHRLAGPMNFLLRNDPDLSGAYGGRLSVRPLAWREHVPEGSRFALDASRVGIPPREILGWRDYVSLLWDSAPMFLIGTKGRGLAWVPEHPTLLRFLRDAPAGGWPARTLDGGETRVVPEMSHVAASDWTYFGPARIRWKFRDDCPGTRALVEAWDRGEIEAYLEKSLEKVVVESRGSSAQPPGEELVSVALVTGLLANLAEAEAFALEEPSAFWVEAFEASTTLPFDTEVRGRPVPTLARELVGVARRGLGRLGDVDAAAALSALERRIDERRSPAEVLLDEFRRNGVAGVVRLTRLVRP